MRRWRPGASLVLLVRLQAALPALAAGEPLHRVSRGVGYGTVSAFVAAFRRETGTTPGAYFGARRWEAVGAPVPRCPGRCGSAGRSRRGRGGCGRSRRRNRREGLDVRTARMLNGR
ncbi:helix-turn-helix domain-containing protein [Streptomyces sp. NPDC127061]|uniref:helix-turn-helix domain-containing protein n=1 Tax=Streptomyces sp. NPDC127061 TaxID=3347122 RepID=UPI00365CC31B